jgi:hypothetical protein
VGCLLLLLILNFNQFASCTDFCELCPSNGECYQGKLECVRGYRKHGKFCVEDGDINETAKKLVCPRKTYSLWYTDVFGQLD